MAKRKSSKAEPQAKEPMDPPEPRTDSMPEPPPESYWDGPPMDLMEDSTPSQADGIVNPVLRNLDPSRRPSPSTVCEVCPAAQWMVTEIDVACYCRFTHKLSWESKERVPIQACSGLIDALRIQKAREQGK